MQKPDSTGREPLTLVGAGLVGSLLSIFLARRGHKVRILERRPDMRTEKISAGRSINLALSVRGIHALERLGLAQEVLSQAVPMKGRMIHAVDGALNFQRYGRNDSECINSVSRAELNKLLMSRAEATGKVEILFNRRVDGVDFEKETLTFRDERTGEVATEKAQRVIGTDGSASVIRAEIVKKTGGHSSEHRLAHGYKELVIPPGPGGSFQLEKNALHIWPRGTYMLIALPNWDGSFTCTLFLPLAGPLSFAVLKEPGQVRELFEKQFTDALPLIADLETTFFENPTGHMVTVKSEPWHYRDRALLVGDAAHAIVPFFGQGMNCGFEDCSVFDELLSKCSSLEEVFRELTLARKVNADAIADMAVENFVEMSDKVGNPRFLLEKGIERVLQERFPAEYASRYALVTFSREPYRFAYDVGVVQAEILSELSRDLDSPEKVDLTKAESLIRAKLAPIFKTKGLHHGS